MADRKVLVKYYPPDFDPEKLREKSRQLRYLQGKKKKTRLAVRQMNVRFMFPFTMCCGTCGEFIYIGTKFNSRVERVRTEDYLGIAIWRFYGRCPHCRAEIAFKTDPKNTEYVLEFGGTRTYDPKRDAELAATALKEQHEEDMTDTMKALEHKTYSTANELIALEQLDELRMINRRFLNREATLDDALEWLKSGGISATATAEGEKVVDLASEEERDLQQAREEMAEKNLRQTLGASNSSAESESEVAESESTLPPHKSRPTRADECPPLKPNNNTSRVAFAGKEFFGIHVKRKAANSAANAEPKRIRKEEEVQPAMLGQDAPHPDDDDDDDAPPPPHDGGQTAKSDTPTGLLQGYYSSDG